MKQFKVRQLYVQLYVQHAISPAGTLVTREGDNIRATLDDIVLASFKIERSWSLLVLIANVSTQRSRILKTMLNFPLNVTSASFLEIIYIVPAVKLVLVIRVSQHWFLERCLHRQDNHNQSLDYGSMDSLTLLQLFAQ
jgi:hypothetical protein